MRQALFYARRTARFGVVGGSPGAAAAHSTGNAESTHVKGEVDIESMSALSRRARGLLRASLVLICIAAVLGEVSGTSKGPSTDLRWAYRPPFDVDGWVLIVVVAIFQATFLWLSRGDGRRESQTTVNAFFAIEFAVSLLIYPDYRNIVMFQLSLLSTPKTAIWWTLVMLAISAIVYAIGVRAGDGGVDDIVAGVLRVEHLYEFIGMLLTGVFLYAITALLYTESELNRRLRQAQAQLALQTREQERQALTMELHDSIGHHMTALRMQLVLALRRVQDDGRERLSQALTTVDRLLVELRSLVDARSERNPLPLAEQLQALVGAIVKPDVHIAIEDNLPRLPGAVEKTVFRVCQEALTNAIRHSDAERLEMRITTIADVLRLAIRDDGRGSNELRWGSGLQGMAERVQRCGGTFSIMSREGEGVTIKVDLPLSGVRP